MDKRICFLYTETTGLHQTNETITKKNLFCFARLVVLNYEIGVYKNGEYTIEKQERMNQVLNEIFSYIESFDDKRVEKIFRMRYLNGRKKLTPWRKIAKELDLSIQGCINIHNSAFKKLKKTYQKKYD